MKYMETGGSDIEVGGLLWKSMTASTERGCRSFKLVQVHFHQQQWKLPRASMEVNWKLFYFKKVNVTSRKQLCFHGKIKKLGKYVVNPFRTAVLYLGTNHSNFK